MSTHGAQLSGEGRSGAFTVESDAADDDRPAKVTKAKRDVKPTSTSPTKVESSPTHSLITLAWAAQRVWGTPRHNAPRLYHRSQSPGGGSARRAGASG